MIQSREDDWIINSFDKPFDMTYGPEFIEGIIPSGIDSWLWNQL